MNADPAYQQAGADYLQTPKSNPAFERIDSWLMLAFAGQPKLQLAPYSLEKKPRIFELRTYRAIANSRRSRGRDVQLGRNRGDARGRPGPRLLRPGVVGKDCRA